MPTPYATVLVPAHHKTATLRLALATLKPQTIENIEVLIACDGATEATLQIAHEYAASDSRARVLDLPKGHNRGGATRATALAQAKADRVMILQDDDLWFPNHVEVLGAQLDQNDVVTAPTLAVRQSGSIAAWISNYAFEGFRNIARTSPYKLIFEANYAFRLDSYYSRRVAWENVEHAGNIRRLLDCHLADPKTRWASVAQATALSFNGPVFATNHDPTPIQAGWLERIESGYRGSHALASAEWAGLLVTSAEFCPPFASETLDQYLARLGLGYPNGSPGRLRVPLSPSQHSDLEHAFQLLTGTATVTDRTAAIALDLAEPYKSPYPLCWPTALLLHAVFGANVAREIAGRALQTADVDRQILGRGLLASVELKAGNLQEARRHAELALAESELYTGFFERQLTRINDRLERGVRRARRAG